MRELSLRFAVGSPTGSRSSVWRLWVPRPHRQSDVYLAIRHLAAQLKVSFHASGWCHEAWVTEAYGDGAHARFGGSPRRFTKWERPPARQATAVRLYRIAYFGFSLAGHTPDEVPADTLWLRPPTGGRMLAIDLVVADSSWLEVCPSLSRMAAESLIRWKLANGESLLVVSQELERDARVLAAYQEFRRTHAAEIQALPRDARSRLLVGNIRVDGLRYVLDLPYDHPADGG